MTIRRTAVIAALASAGTFALLGGNGALAGSPAANTTPARTDSGPVADVAAGDRFAVVNADGTTARGKGVNSSTSLGGGSYEVRFNRNVSLCAYIATIGSSATSGTEPTGQITTVRRAGTQNGVFISTTDSAGNGAPRGFHLLLACP